MTLNTYTVKKAVLKLNYRWFNDRPNIVAIRTTLQVPDVFNDIMFLEWVDEKGLSNSRSYVVTTEPGVTHQKKLLNVKGCAVILKGQYINCYAVGFHQNKTDHRALVQVGKITVARDNDMDGQAETEGMQTDTGLFGVNIHGANKLSKTEKIGAWSAGCIVFQTWKDKEEFVSICENFKEKLGNRFTLTVIEEKDI